jgi:hypothetical protein
MQREVGIAQQSRNGIKSREDPNSVHIHKLVDVGEQYQSIDEKYKYGFKGILTHGLPIYSSLSNEELRRETLNSTFGSHMSTNQRFIYV